MEDGPRDQAGGALLPVASTCRNRRVLRPLLGLVTHSLQQGGQADVLASIDGRLMDCMIEAGLGPGQSGNKECTTISRGPAHQRRAAIPPCPAGASTPHTPRTRCSSSLACTGFT